MAGAADLVHRAGAGFRSLSTYSQHWPLVFESVCKVACRVRLLRGTLRGGDERLTLLYAGRDRNYDYLLRTIFEENESLEELRCNLLTVRKHLARLRGSADVLIGDLSWPYNGLLRRQGGYISVPDWVDMYVEMPERWEDVVLSFRLSARKNDLRLIRRNRYRCVATRDREAIEQFYDEWYVPFVSGRHAGYAVIAPRRHVIRRASQGSLLQIMRDDDVVAAGVVYPEGEVMCFLWTGLPPHYVDRPPEAAISALYFLGIRHAHELGFRLVDFAGTRAFLTDGPLHFKRKWGAAISDSFSPASILIQPVAGSSNAFSFCRRFPVLRRTPEGLEAVIVAAEEGVDAETFARLEKNYGCGGIARITIIEITNENETRLLPNDRGRCQYRLLRTRPESFAAHYSSQA